MENYDTYQLTRDLSKTKLKKCERCTEEAVMELNGIWLCSACGLKEIRSLRDEEIVSVNGIEREEEPVEISIENEF